MTKLSLINKDWDLLDLVKHVLERNGYRNTDPQFFDKNSGNIHFADVDEAERAKSILKKYHIETKLQGEHEP